MRSIILNSDRYPRFDYSWQLLNSPRPVRACTPSLPRLKQLSPPKSQSYPLWIVSRRPIPPSTQRPVPGSRVRDYQLSMPTYLASLFVVSIAHRPSRRMNTPPCASHPQYVCTMYSDNEWVRVSLTTMSFDSNILLNVEDRIEWESSCLSRVLITWTRGVTTWIVNWSTTQPESRDSRRWTCRSITRIPPPATTMVTSNQRFQLISVIVRRLAYWYHLLLVTTTGRKYCRPGPPPFS